MKKLLVAVGLLPGNVRAGDGAATSTSKEAK